MGTNTETFGHTICREWDTLKATLNSNECLHQIPPLRLLGALHKWRCKELERMEDTRDTRPAKVSRTTHISYISWGSMHRACMGLDQVGSIQLKEKWRMSPFLTQNLPASSCRWEVSSPKGVFLRQQMHFKGWLHAQQEVPNRKQAQQHLWRPLSHDIMSLFPFLSFFISF